MGDFHSCSKGVDVVIGGHPHILQPYGRMSDDQGHNMLIFYSLGNFVSTQQTLTGLLEGMASFTIQKSVKNGVTTIDILDPTVKPMVMHYNKDEGVFNPYMLEDYTEELASQHGVKEIIGDEFTLANLQAKFKEIMSMNVEPSTRTDLLDVSFDYELNMIDSNGNVVEDTWSVSAEDYLAGQEIPPAATARTILLTVPMMDPMMILPMTIHTTTLMMTPMMTPMMRITDHP